MRAYLRDAMVVGVIVLTGGLAGPARAEHFAISTPAGPIQIQISHLGPSGSLAAPPPPEPQEFRPPSIFSAPLPSGSGARALGLAGAFTALADDATAASWNPAGLLQLQRPEASIVYRFSEHDAEHRSDDPGFRVGEDHFDTEGMNYFSLAYPFHVKALGRNMVLSLNYQEAYDFGQRFTAEPRARKDSSDRAVVRQSYEGDQTSTFKDSVFDVTIRTHVMTDATSAYDQTLRSAVWSDLDYAQEGVLSALTPALALEITPKLSLGVAGNFYLIDPLAGDSIRSVSRSRYAGRSLSDVEVRDRRTTSATYVFDGTMTIPPGSGFSDPEVEPFSGSGSFPSFTREARQTIHERLDQQGVVTEENEFTDLNGFNATIGTMYTVNRLLTLGAAVDLPWTASARQTRTVRSSTLTYQGGHRGAADVVRTEESESKDVEFEFPLFWSAGMLLRWTPQLYTTLDVGQTRWSDFSFRADGGGRLNPLDGTPYGEHPLDDCWSYRAGLEYLVLWRGTEIPLRCGAAREERPALGAPDLYHSLSLGTGVGMGREPGRTYLDVAYVYTWADDVQGIVPERALRSDLQQQEIYFSAIRHF